MLKILKTVILSVLISFIFIESFIFLGMIKIKENDISSNFDYIIVLGEKLDDNEMSDILVDRLNCAFKLYKKNKNAKLILSGGLISKNTISEASIMSDFLLNLGVSQSDIILEDKATSTFENIEFSQKLIDNKNKNIALISSDFHMPRALVISKNMRLKVTPYCSDTDFMVKFKRLLCEYPRLLVDIVRSFNH